jgi:two-component system chemotaxis response regulator CheY
MKVLIIDDEPLVRKSLARVFMAQGWDVHIAEGGIEGHKQWVALKPEVVVLDILMPDLSGPKLLELSPPASFVVLISAYKGEYSDKTVKSLGAQMFIAKPFEDIFQTVNIIEKEAHAYYSREI